MIVSPDEIKEATKQLDENKSCSIDTITAEHVKYASLKVNSW